MISCIIMWGLMSIFALFTLGVFWAMATVDFENTSKMHGLNIYKIKSYKSNSTQTIRYQVLQKVKQPWWCIAVLFPWESKGSYDTVTEARAAAAVLLANYKVEHKPYINETIDGR